MLDQKWIVIMRSKGVLYEMAVVDFNNRIGWTTGVDNGLVNRSRVKISGII